MTTRPPVLRQLRPRSERLHWPRGPLPSLDRVAFREALLTVMDGKTHWAWPAFESGRVPRERLNRHFEQEWDVWVRDLSVLFGRAHAQCPVPEVRREIAARLYEEETGGICAGRPHSQLFLEIARGLGMELSRFESVTRGPAAQTFRDLLDECTTIRGWAVALAVSTLFLDGRAPERHIFDPEAPAPSEPTLDAHPLVVHYGIATACLALVGAHRALARDRRRTTWRMVIDHTPEEDRRAVVASLRQVRNAWLMYRDEVAYGSGLTRS
ncbi:MAG: iron-containing redox enzyme family protein [Myxococcota bacterium]